MELVQDIVIGSLGGLVVRQIKKMVFGPATDPNAAQQVISCFCHIYKHHKV